MPKCWYCKGKTEIINLGNDNFIKACSICGRARRPNQSITQVIICKNDLVKKTDNNKK